MSETDRPLTGFQTRMSGTPWCRLRLGEPKVRSKCTQGFQVLAKHLLHLWFEQAPRGARDLEAERSVSIKHGEQHLDAQSVLTP